QGGLTHDGLVAAIASSPEYAGHLGATADDNWVRAVYGDLLLRGATTGDVTYWTGVLQRGTSRDSVAWLIEQSGEYRSVQANPWVQGLYQTLLRRTTTSAEMAYWVTQTVTTSQEAVVTNILLSEEYYRRAALNP